MHFGKWISPGGSNHQLAALLAKGRVAVSEWLGGEAFDQP
tara:strand:+ start:143 stop:262 length:120 start_codon:yes stop_codon:yes gene_type:complete